MVKLINGTSAQDTILGTRDADSIFAGAGSDFIYGFLGADTIDGGTGYDTLFITGASLDLNNSANEQLVNVEEVSAKSANGGVTINLSRQNEGFVLTGSAYNDILTGGAGTNNIDAGDGNDTIYGFGASDTVNGGGGADTLILSASIDFATDAQITDIENIVASGASAGVIINLGRQHERFYLIGSGFADQVTGGSGADVINTGSGDDTINGFLGNDYINGGAGADTLILTATSVYLNAAIDIQLSDVETVSAAQAAAGVNIDLSSQSEGFTIIGSNQSDVLKGGSGSDIFIGSSGLDTIDGGFGDNILLLTADLGNLSNAQLVNVGTISAANALVGVSINLSAQNERLTVTGSAYADVLTGGLGVDRISTGGGDDIIKGFVSADTVDGGDGFDTLVLTATSTSLNSATDSQLVNMEAILASTALAGVNINLSTQSDSFTITGGNYSDTLIGGAGDDTFYGFVGSDNIDGGNGFDTLILKATSVNLNGATDTQLTGLEAISAADAPSGVIISLLNQSEAYSLTGSNYADQITGTYQSDIFNGFVGADTIDGGASSDILKLTATSLELNTATNAQLINVEKITAATATAGVTIDLSAQTERINLVGGAYDDTLTGGVAADNLMGGSGADYLNGGAGNDVLTGGLGADHFIFSKPAATSNVDTIADFTHGEDSLSFSKSAFASLGNVGQLADDDPKFWSSATATTAHDADDRLVYNTTTGALYYDADGLGGASAVQIATLSAHPQLLSGDIFVI